MLLEMVGLSFNTLFLVLNSIKIALWSKSEFCMAGRISQVVVAAKRGILIIKKSILDLFCWLIFLGQKVKSVLEGKKSLYGSVIFNREHSSLTKFECLKFGGLAIFLQSMLVKIGSTEKVQFQSPPIRTGQLPRFRIAASSLVKKSGLGSLGP